jgi:hypothetical protein
VVLALFCLAWLQAAAVPCAMASASAATMPAGGQHCPYCPPGDSTPSTSAHGGTCAYPHEPGVDARAAATLLFAAVPVSSFVLVPDVARHDLLATAVASAEPVPRVPIPLRFCRYLE